MEKLEDQLRQRYEEYTWDKNCLQQYPLKIVIFGGEKVAQFINGDRTYSGKYLNMVKQYAGMKVIFFWLGIGNQSIAFNSGEIHRDIKDRGLFFVFEEISNVKITDVSISTVRKFKKKLEQEECYLVTREDVKKIKLIAEE